MWWKNEWITHLHAQAGLPTGITGWRLLTIRCSRLPLGQLNQNTWGGGGGRLKWSTVSELSTTSFKPPKAPAQTHLGVLWDWFVFNFYFATLFDLFISLSLSPSVLSDMVATRHTWQLKFKLKFKKFSYTSCFKCSKTNGYLKLK